MKIPFKNYFIGKRENKVRRSPFEQSEHGCKCCHREMDLRMGYCFDCVEMQSVLLEGKDMYDNEIGQGSFEKLSYIIKRANRMGLY